MRRFTAGLAALLLVGFALAQDKPKEESKKTDIPTREEQLNQLTKDGFLKTYRESKDRDVKAQALEGYRADPKQFAPKILELAKAKPDDATGCDAAIWLIQNVRDEKEVKEALEILRAHHLASPKMANVVTLLAYAEREHELDFLKAVFDKNPDRKIRASSLRFLANNATNAVTNYFTAEKDIPVRAAEAIKLWEQVLKEFGDLEEGRSKIAKDELLMLKNFLPGSKALEISGLDTENKPIKLSDFKGRVIMLDFWGTWCGHCMQMVPHNVQVVKKYEGRPFVLAGVNSDRDKEKLASRIKEEKINYRSFWNGEEGPHGPISKEWKVQAWPTIILIDHQGVIRRRFTGRPNTEESLKALDQALESLIKEAEAK